MIFAVLFEDNPGKEDLRQAHMQDHLTYLEAQSGVLGAGPLFDTDGTASGGMWLIEAESAEAVAAMVRDDPLHGAGLRRSISIRAWRQVLRDGRRLGQGGSRL